MINPLILYRVSRWLHLRGIKAIPTWIQQFNYFLTGCDLTPRAVIGKRVRFQHYGAGVILHANVIIGDDVWIMPQVVIGQNVRRGGRPVPFKDVAIRIGNRVMLGAGAKIIADGVLEIGEEAAVGANAVVTHSVPARALAVGVPARIIVPNSDQDTAQ